MHAEKQSKRTRALPLYGSLIPYPIGLLKLLAALANCNSADTLVRTHTHCRLNCSTTRHTVPYSYTPHSLHPLAATVGLSAAAGVTATQVRMLRKAGQSTTDIAHAWPCRASYTIPLPDICVVIVIDMAPVRTSGSLESSGVELFSPACLGRGQCIAVPQMESETEYTPSLLN